MSVQSSAISLTFPDISWPRLDDQDLRAVILWAVFFGLIFVEGLKGYRKSSARLIRQSYMSNLGIFILNDTVLSLLSIASLWTMAEHYAGWGLLNLIGHSVWKPLMAFLLLDLTLYLWHKACHRFERLWLFHRVHHSDLCMNASTAFRTHIVEVFLTTVIKAVYIVVAGVDTWTLLISEAAITVATVFHHANVGFPGEQRLGRIIVVPSLHRVHHSVRRQEHDSNYGAFFSFWDKLFGTFKELEPEKLGLQEHGEQSVFDLLLLGFKPLRPAQVASTPLNVRQMIQEAAYYRAEKRGFMPGFEFKDWFEAEQEIQGRHHK